MLCINIVLKVSKLESVVDIIVAKAARIKSDAEKFSNVEVFFSWSVSFLKIDC